MTGRGDELRALARDMELALRSELGARSLYPLLARLARHEELREVLESLGREEVLQVERLRALLSGLGADPPARRLRRSAISWLLAASTPLLGMRLALRVCHDAESTAARWYAEYAAWFLERGDEERAAVCRELSVTKLRHASSLEAFVRNVPGRRGLG